MTNPSPSFPPLPGECSPASAGKLTPPAKPRTLPPSIPKFPKSTVRTMGRIERSRELARRRTRRVKLKKLREKLAAAKTDADKQAIVAKARKISPLAELV